MASIKKNIVYSVALRILNVLFPTITVPYVSRILGVENVGIVHFVLTYVGYFILFATLGVSYYGIREIAKHRDNFYNVSKIFTEIFSINIVSTVISTVIFILTVSTIPSLAAERVLLLITGILLYLTPLSIDWLFQGLEDFKVITIRSIIIRITCLIALFIFVREKDDVIPYILLNVVSGVGVNFWNYWYAQKKYIKLNFHHLELQKHIKPVLVLFISVIAINICMDFSTVMLGFLSTYEEVGYYASASKITRMILPIFTAISMVLMPRISSNNEKNEHDLNRVLIQKSFDLTALVAIPAMVGLVLIASQFVPVFFGAGYTGTIIPLKILSLLTLVGALNVFFGVQILVGIGHERAFLKAVVIAAMMNIILNLVLIPVYGAAGAAIASIIGESAQLIMNLFFIYKCTDIRIMLRNSSNACWCTLPIIGLYFILSPMNMDNVYFLILFITASALTYFVFQYFIFQNYLLKNFYSQIIDKFKK